VATFPHATVVCFVFLPHPLTILLRLVCRRVPRTQTATCFVLSPHPLSCCILRLVLIVQGLVSLRAKYGFLLVVDEAHATLVTGAHGGGAAEAAGVEAQVDVHTGERWRCWRGEGRGLMGTGGGSYPVNRHRRPLLHTLNRWDWLPVPKVSVLRSLLAGGSVGQGCGGGGWGGWIATGQGERRGGVAC
jgi:hypothetical protein